MKIKNIFILICSFFYYLFILIKYKKEKINLTCLFSRRIGHLSIETELYLLDRKINKTKGVKDLFFFDPFFSISNKTLGGLIKKKINILNSFIGFYLLKIDNFFFYYLKKKKFYNYVFTRSDKSELRNYPPFLNFSNKQVNYGISLLKEIGIYNKKFVCLVNRDSSYLKKKFTKDYSHHDYRNSSISNYLDAAKFLAERKIYTIRMGESVSEKINIKNKYIIDYAVNGMRSDFLDIFIPYNCYFWISGGAGIDSLSKIFRKPILSANLCPISPLNWPGYDPEKTLIIFKYLYSHNTNNLLPMKKIFEDRLERLQHSNNYKEKNISLIENSSDEILYATKEMLDILEKGPNKSLHLKNIESNFWKIANVNNYKCQPAMISSFFLEKNKKLFE